MIGVFAAISAAMAVAAGAFGAHGAAGPTEAEWLRTGGIYQLIHAVAALAIMGFARGPAITLLVGGSFLIESVFDINGFGYMGFEAAVHRDYPIVMGVLTLSSFLLLLGNILSDIILAVMNPRIRFD